ncbi:MAG: PAS domain S-box protein [Candidatus Ancaeobacter aquaticus]|nr:PAS domain S-box protein [Candidatus Ancaeobacter aquaticus]
MKKLPKWFVFTLAFASVALLLGAMWVVECQLLPHDSFLFCRSYDLIKDILIVLLAVIIIVELLFKVKSKSEHDVQMKSRLLSNIVDTIVDGVISLNNDGIILSWNKSAEKIFGYTARDIIGEDFGVLVLAGNKDELFTSDINKKLEKQGMVKDYEVQMKCSGGKLLWVNLSCSILKDLNGKKIGLSLIIHDITETKLFVEKIQQSEKLVAVGQLAAGIAHEVLTPLNVISGNAEYLLMGMDKHDDRVRELQIIIDETEKINKLIKRMMEFAQPKKSEMKKVDINTVLQEILNFTQPQLIKSHIEVEMEFDKDLPEIMADEAQIEQAFLSIEKNAWEAMKKGGALTIRTSFWIDAEDKKEYIKIQFTDTGYGIRDDNIKRVFDPFFSTKDIGKGTGLGLTIAYKIIADQGGSIDIDSSVDIGTTVVVTLPVRNM